MKIFVFVFMTLSLTSAYCAGVLEDPVNVQEFDLTHIDDIMISYRSEDIKLFKSNSDLLVIEEYMSRDNSDFYAKINNSGNNLTIEAGRRPISLVVNSFTAHIEIYIPVSSKNITIKTSSGKIEGSDVYTASSINVECSSGNISLNSVIAKTADFRTLSGSISLNSITAETVNFRNSSGTIRCNEVNGNADIHASSGNILFGSIKGNVLAEVSSGRIELGLVSGTLDAKTSSGSINCTVTETAGDISLTSSSGGVTLNVPRNFAFNFSSRKTSGSLRTPFQDRLVSPVSDKNTVQGVINGGNTAGSQNLKNVNIRTTSGSIRVNWTD